MANIERSIKTFGTREFATERAAAPGNKAPILSAEVDLDFNTIYSAWNGGIEIGDLKPGFVIDHAHLGVDAVESNNIKDGTITSNDLGPNCVTSAKILDGTITHLDIGSQEVWGTNIKDGAVVLSKIAAGATIRYKQQVDSTPLITLPDDKTEHIILTSGTFTITGTLLNIWANLMVGMAPYVSGGHGIGQFRIYVFQGSGPDVMKHNIQVPPSGPDVALFTVPLQAMADNLTPGVLTTVRVAAQQIQTGGVIPYWQLVSGRLVVEEPS